jgi:hypothetical protein
MIEKRNSFCAFCLAAAIFLAPGLAHAEETATPLAVHMPAQASAPEWTDHRLVLDQWLDNLRKRNRDQAFAMLSAASQDRYGPTAKTFMNTVRLKNGPLYDHVRYEVLEAAAEADIMFYRLALVDRRERRHIALVRLTKDSNDGWRVQSVVVIRGHQGREA